MSYQVPDDTPYISRARIFLFNSFCFLTFIIVFIVGYYFILIDLFSYPLHEWMKFLSKEITSSYGRKALIPLIPYIPFSLVCICTEYLVIEYNKRLKTGLWYLICGMLLLISFLIFLLGIFAAY
ncbi:hypothetical protein [Herpetosiphon giganteus]|uniref:hypothetical protein n=1 Tax=Herpetosiphon giganteus TaxID=2029754 RepID=UPI00195A09FD|nr:hypothetical protein [Herpetosiphon giganteus]MBM7844309.1 hypothetical protein [Herpetosiphon giganteus]